MGARTVLERPRADDLGELVPCDDLVGGGGDRLHTGRLPSFSTHSSFGAPENRVSWWRMRGKCCDPGI